MANYRVSDQKGDFQDSNVYYDEKNRLVYYDWLTKQAYYMGKKEVEKYFRFQIFTPLAVLTPLLMVYMFHFNWILSIVVGVLIFVGGKALFTVNVVYNLVPVKDFTKPKHSNFIHRLANEPTAAKSIAGGIICLVIAVIAYINTLYTEYTTVMLWGNYLMALGALITSGCYFFSLYIRHKNKKNNKEDQK